MFEKRQDDWRYKLAHLPDDIFLVFSNILKALIFGFNTVIKKWQSHYSVWDELPRWERARKLSRPFHYLWVMIYKSMMRKDQQDYDLLDVTEGLVIISGNTGAGKSTLVFDVAEKDRLLNGKPWYINTLIEKPRWYSPLDAYVRFHRYMPFDNVWSDYKMHIQLDNTFGGFILDEIHRIFDYRQNQTNQYMSKFIPFRDYAVIVRKHIKKLIGLTQMDRLDIQLMHLVHLWVKPKIDIGFDYEDWMIHTGIFRFKIKGWYIDAYDVDTSTGNDFLKYKTSWYRKATANFEYFDTYAFSDVYDHVKKDDMSVNYA